MTDLEAEDIQFRLLFPVTAVFLYAVFFYDWGDHDHVFSQVSYP